MPDPLNVARNGQPANLAGLWAPNPAFLVCGGPSLNDVPLERLRERGVVSLGVNQAAAWAPVRAWVFSDNHAKFHHGLFLDPGILSFVPAWKLNYHVHLKDQQGFHTTPVRIGDCPSTYGYDRRTMFVPERFFTDSFAHWGPRKDQPKDCPQKGCLCTMLIGIRVLYYLGIKRIYLIGVDYKGQDGLCYGFPEEKRERNRRYYWERHMLSLLQPGFQKVGLEFYNCSPDSALDLFPYCSFQEAIADCKGSVPEEPLDTYGWYNNREREFQCQANPRIIPLHYGERSNGA